MLKFIHKYGNDLCFSLLIYDFVKSPNNSKKKKYLKFFSFIKNNEVPKLPVFGKDVINMGVKSGPIIGKILKSVEDWWINNKAKPNRQQCLKKLKELC